MAKTQSLVSFSIAILLLSACSKNKDPEGQSLIEDQGLAEYRAASCKFGVNDGGNADYDGKADIQTTYFDKKFDNGLLAPLLKASMRETLRFEQEHSVKLFHVNESVSSCNPLDIAGATPPDFQKHWDKVATAQNGQRMILVGLYIPKSSPDVESSTETAEIGIRRDANRWVMLHEFMHHLFETQATAEGHSSPELDALYDERSNQLNKDVDAYNEASDTDKPIALKAVVATFILMNDVVRQQIVRFPLEEVTIETMLQKKMNGGELEFAPMMLGSSNAYIRQSATRATKFINEFQGKTADLKKLADTAGLSDESAKLEAAINQYETLRSQIATTTRSSAASIAQFAHIGFDRGSDETQATIFTCSHTRKTDQFRTQLNEILNKLRLN